MDDEEMGTALFNVLCLVVGAGLIWWTTDWKYAVGIFLVALFIKAPGRRD